MRKATIFIRLSLGLIFCQALFPLIAWVVIAMWQHSYDSHQLSTRALDYIYDGHPPNASRIMFIASGAGFLCAMSGIALLFTGLRLRGLEAKS